MVSLQDALRTRVDAMFMAGTAAQAAELERTGERLIAALADVTDADPRTCDGLADTLEIVRDTAAAALELLRPADPEAA